MTSKRPLYTTHKMLWFQNLLEDRFGVKFELREEYELDTPVIRLKLRGSDKCVLFDNLQPKFLEAGVELPFCQYNIEKETERFAPVYGSVLPMPGVAYELGSCIERAPFGYRIHFDILGLAFWMLNRVEEIGRADLDEHHRFPATSSHAYKYNYLDRPIVDQWFDILRQVFQRVWPQIKLKKNNFSIKVSHDVDMPAKYAFQNPKGLIRTLGGDLLLRRDFRGAISAPWIWMRSRHEIHHGDPFNTFNWLMEQSEKSGLRSAFYFICGRTNAKKDALYNLEMPQIRSLMKSIYSRGHEIGLHPSYETYKKPESICSELERLKRVCAEERIYQDIWGGRMHYLRWDQAITPRAWNDCGLAYDSTLGYADLPGFRCGTCFEFNAFDIEKDVTMKLRIRPLIAMDCTVISERYLGLGDTEAAYLCFSDLKEKCRDVNGVFTLLWHNSFFKSNFSYSIYQRLIKDSS